VMIAGNHKLTELHISLLLMKMHNFKPLSIMLLPE
jgi:hypothetical protein